MSNYTEIARQNRYEAMKLREIADDLRASVLINSGVNSGLDNAARLYLAECQRLGEIPACIIPAVAVETPEEREAFELLERRQRDPQVCDNRQMKINSMAAIARQCPTTSIEGICALLVDAGYRKE